jgi:hypothetical protein
LGWSRGSRGMRGDENVVSSTENEDNRELFEAGIVCEDEGDYGCGDDAGDHSGEVSVSIEARAACPRVLHPSRSRKQPKSARPGWPRHESSDEDNSIDGFSSVKSARPGWPRHERAKMRWRLEAKAVCCLLFVLLFGFFGCLSDKNLKLSSEQCRYEY